MRNLLASETKKARLPEVTALSVLLCLQVVFIHASSAPVESFLEGNKIWGVVFVPWRLLSINVRGFIFLSGLKLFVSKRDRIDYGAFYRGRFLKIVLPYILWNVIYYLYFVNKGYFGFSAPDLLAQMASGTLVAPFYFVIVIIQFYALAPMWMYIVKKFHPLLVITPAAVLSLFLHTNLRDILSLIGAGGSFLYSDRVFTSYLLFWLAGCYVGLYYEEAKKLLTGNKKYISAMFLVFAALEAVLSYISFSGARKIEWLEYIHYLYCLCAVMFLFTFFLDRFKTRELKSKLIKAIERASYQIFLTHCLVMAIVDDLLAQAGVSRTSTAYLIRIGAVYSITLSACILWNSVRDKIAKKLRKPPSNAAGVHMEK